jgi:hypothetical protein
MVHAGRRPGLDAEQRAGPGRVRGVRGRACLERLRLESLGGRAQVAASGWRRRTCTAGPCVVRNRSCGAVPRLLRSRAAHLAALCVTEQAVPFSAKAAGSRRLCDWRLEAALWTAIEAGY